MNNRIEEIRKELTQLKKEPFLNDEEFDKQERLEEELKILENQEDKPKETIETKNVQEQKKEESRQKRSLLEIGIQWWKKRKDISPEDLRKYEEEKLRRIKKLSLDKKEAELERDIVKAKAQKKKLKGNMFENIFGEPKSKNQSFEKASGEDLRKKMGRNHKDSDYRKVFGCILMGAVMISLISFLPASSNEIMMGTKDVNTNPYLNNGTQNYDLGGGIIVKGVGYDTRDNPYQCPNSGDITSIACKGFGTLHDDLQNIFSALLNILMAENLNNKIEQNMTDQLNVICHAVATPNNVDKCH